MRRLTTLAAVGLTFIAAAAVPAELATPVSAQGPFVAPAAVTAPPVAPACVVSQREHRTYTRKVYRRGKVTGRARGELRRMRSCAKNTDAARNMRAVERRARRARRARARRAALMLCGTPICNRRLFVSMAMRRYGGSGVSCSLPVLGQESGFNHRINYGGRVGPPGGGAYGIPQALPAHKMASAGPDWATNPATQIRWFFSYVDGRYGGPCGALAFKRAKGWY